MKVKNLSKFSWYHLTLGAEVDLFQSLRDFLAKENLSQAFILTCIGSCK
jgi:predicted DNA-binding protein with PD1-like motif